jgi:branched-chain amino acid transport system ATP-binding protein
VLRIDSLHLSYGGVLALRGVSFEVQGGEVVTLIGSNGAGKSSTLNAISGTVKASRGSIHFQDRPIQGWAPHKVARAGIIQVPEGRALFNGMSVLENLEIGRMAARGKRGLNSVVQERIWQLFPILNERRHQLAGTLSGGERQMLAIGPSLMAQPQLLLMDEPSLGLAPLMVTLIFQIIPQLRDQGLTILLVEQNAWMSLQVSDRGYVMESGRMVLSGPSPSLIEDANVKRIYLGGR